MAPPLTRETPTMSPEDKALYLPPVCCCVVPSLDSECDGSCSFDEQPPTVVERGPEDCEG